MFGHMKAPRDPSGASELDRLVLVSRLYYELDRSQEDISRKLNVSRSTVSRMLANARRSGIVNITIDGGDQRNRGLEQALSERFSLRSVIVVTPEGGAIGPLDHLGRAAAQVIDDLVRDDIIIGVGHGGSVAATARFLEPRRAFHVSVTELVGSLNLTSEPNDAAEIARVVADAYSATRRPFPAPAFVQSRSARDSIVAEPMIRAALEAMRSATIALIGIGSWDPEIFDTHVDHHVLVSALGEFEPRRIRDAGGVGHLCGTTVDAQGRPLPTVEGGHVPTGIDLDGLGAIETVVAVAGGVGKAPAIAAALRGKLVDILVTDANAARRILQEEGASASDDGTTAVAEAGLEVS